MPISLLPSDRRLFWLKVDADIPLESRPVFICKTPLRKTMIEWARLYDEAVALEGEEAFRKLFEATCVGVIGWKNFGEREFNFESVDETLTKAEQEELALNWMNAFKMTEEERRGFTLPQPSVAASSAETATADATLGSSSQSAMIKA